MDAGARRLLNQFMNKERSKRQAMRQMADGVLTISVTSTPPQMVVDESRANMETDGGRRKLTAKRTQNHSIVHNC
jgi:hypothetical protein